MQEPDEVETVVSVPKRPHLLRTNINLYISLMIVDVTFVCLGLNFLLTRPTFEQFGIPKDLIGASFFTIGIANFIVVNVFNNVRAMRVCLLMGMALMFCWGIGTTQTFFQGKSSLQLFILYSYSASIQAPLVMTAYLSLVTANR